MKKAIIVHCWTGYPQYCWYPYVKKELETRGFEVKVPFLPDALPLLDRWLDKLREVIGIPDKDTILIGHSLGCVTVLKYLQSLPEPQRVGGVVLVSGFITDLGFRPLYNFFAEPLDFESIKQKADQFVVVASGDDPYIQPFHTSILRSRLQAKVIWKSHGGHFTETDESIQYKQFPEVISAIEMLSRKRYIHPKEGFNTSQKINEIAERQAYDKAHQAR